MIDKTVYLFVHYSNYKGGVNNLQIVHVTSFNGQGTIKTFTSTVDKAMGYARKWSKKNGFIVSA